MRINKLFLSGLMVLIGVSVALAETDSKARSELRSIRNGDNNGDQIKVLRVSGAGTVGGALTVTGASTLNGGLTVVGAVTGTTIDGTKVVGNLPDAAITNWARANFRSGVCTNGEVISFAPNFSITPTVVGTWVGVINSSATNAVLTLPACGVASFRFGCASPQTNKIYWMAIGF